MKVTILSYFSGINSRGVETFVHHIANELVKNKIEVDVFQGGEALTNSLYVTKKLNDPSKLPVIDINSDVIFPLNGRFQSLNSSIWAKINKKKIIISGQSGLGFDDRMNLYTFPNKFIALTKFQSEWAKKINPFVNIGVIPNGVDINLFSYNSKSPKKKTSIPRFLTVGALVKSKRHDLTIKAVSKIPNSYLTIVGEGDQEQDLLKLCKHLLNGRFEIIKSKHSNINDIYQKSDLFVFPTVKYESFGIVLLEAMASNLPIVTNDDQIRREIVGEAGLYVNPEDLDDFANKLNQALDRDWGTIPREQSEKYSWDIIGKQYLQLICNL